MLTAYAADFGYLELDDGKKVVELTQVIKAMSWHISLPSKAVHCSKSFVEQN